MQISVEELLTLLNKLGVDITNPQIKAVIIDEFLPQIQYNRKELIDSVLKQAHFLSSCDGYEELVRAIELKMENPYCQKIYGIIAKEKSGKEDFTQAEYMLTERKIRLIFKRHFHEYNANYNLYPDFIHRMYNDGIKLSNLKLIDFLAIYISSLENTKETIHQKVLKK